MTSSWRAVVGSPLGQTRDVLGRADVLAVGRPAEGRLWLEVTDPGVDDLDSLRSHFGFHPLAIEDVANRHQRPKVDVYDGHVFIVLYVPALDDASIEEIAIFAGSSFVVVVSPRSLPAIDTARARWCQAIEGRGSTAPPEALASDLGLYVLLDSIVDDYFPLLDALGDELEQIEEGVLEGRDDRAAVRGLVALRKRLVTLRRVLGPTRDVVNALTRQELDAEGRGLGAYFLDVYDHLVRLTDSADLYRDLIATAVDAHLTIASNRLNETVRRMTALSTILMSMTLVSGIYGMNFRFMPELESPLGYPWAIALMLLIGGLVALWFRRRGWL